MLSPISLIIGDVLKLLRGQLALLLLAAVLLQVAYWYLGSPGPSLLGGVERGLPAALAGILWAVGLFLLVPLLLLKLARITPAEAGLRWGDARFGLAFTALAAVIALPLLFFGVQDASLQASYPWAGDWPGRSLLTLLTWAGLYALYYLAYEFFFRGFLIRVMEPHWGLMAAIWVQALASALIHLGKPALETLGAVPMAFVFAALAVRTKSILWPALFHLVIGLITDIFSLYHQGSLLP